MNRSESIVTLNSQGWDDIHKGQVDVGLSRIQEACELSRSPATVNSYGTALLFARKYIEAKLFFLTEVNNSPLRYSFCYERLAVSEWLCGKCSMAESRLVESFKCDYTDGAGGMGGALLLFSMSVLNNDLPIKAIAKARISSLVSQPRVANWPGPVGQYVLDPSTRMEVGADSGPDLLLKRRKWYIKFYRAIVAYANSEDCTREMFECSQEVSYDKTIVYENEFYLARWISKEKTGS